MFDLEVFRSFPDQIKPELYKDAIENNLYYKKKIENLTALTKEEEKGKKIKQCGLKANLNLMVPVKKDC